MSAAQKDKEKKAKKEEEKKKAEEGGEEAVEDVDDTGNGDPLFKDFTSEDWALLLLRVELYLLQAAFKKDVNDPDRPGVPEQHAAFYYNKYFRKQLTPKYFGVNTNADLTALVKDTATWNDEKILGTPLEEQDSPGMFVKLTEENRRERQRRIDAGDETARLKFS